MGDENKPTRDDLQAWAPNDPSRMETRTDLPIMRGNLPPPEPVVSSDEADRRWWRSTAPEMMLLLEQVRDLPDLPEDLRERANNVINGMKRHFAALVR